MTEEAAQLLAELQRLRESLAAAYLAMEAGGLLSKDEARERIVALKL